MSFFKLKANFILINLFSDTSNTGNIVFGSMKLGVKKTPVKLIFFLHFNQQMITADLLPGLSEDYLCKNHVLGDQCDKLEVHCEYSTAINVCPLTCGLCPLETPSPTLAATTANSTTAPEIPLSTSYQEESTGKTSSSQRSRLVRVIKKNLQVRRVAVRNPA